SLDVAPRAVTTGGDGRFVVTGLANDVHRVGAFADGYVPVAAVEWDPERTLEIRLDPAAILAGVVLDADRRPIEGASIEVLGESADRQPVAIGAGGGFRSAVFASQRSPVEVVSTPGGLPVTVGPVPPIPSAPVELGSSDPAWIRSGAPGFVPAGTAPSPT